MAIQAAWRVAAITFGTTAVVTLVPILMARYRILAIPADGACLLGAAALAVLLTGWLVLADWPTLHDAARRLDAVLDTREGCLTIVSTAPGTSSSPLFASLLERLSRLDFGRFTATGAPLFPGPT